MTMKQTADMEYIPHLQLKIRLITGLGIVTLLLSIVLFLSYHYAVRQVIVEGNKHYSAQEIQAMMNLMPFCTRMMELFTLQKELQIPLLPAIPLQFLKKQLHFKWHYARIFSDL